MIVSIEISKVQHVDNMIFSVDLSENKITCIVGKNGVGKTTLVKAIKNLHSADTFSKTSSKHIFNNESFIKYTINDEVVTYKYDENLKVIDTKEIVPEVIKSSLFVELPIPHGMRFNSFPTLSKIDTELRKSIAFETFDVPSELISILNYVYETNGYNNLKSFSLKNDVYYFRLNENSSYIREDYFSSGEFFVVNLFRMMQSKKRFIVIDEIDISLDSSAQVHLVKVLRDFCRDHSLNIVFTTHSLPLMKMLQYDELYYMHTESNGTTITSRSYNFIKSTLFGFKGWDRYILTEDETLHDYLEYIIDSENNEYHFECKIIYVGGGTNVTDLMKRNSNEVFLATAENVISVLDGDQRDLRHARRENIFCIPFESIEKDFYQAYLNDESIPRVSVKGEKYHDKQVYKGIVKTYGNGWSAKRIFEYLEALKPEQSEEFRTKIRTFLRNEI